MTKRLQFSLHLTLLAVLVAGLFAWPRPTTAAQVDLSVSPSTVSNAASTTIVVSVSEADFGTEGAVVVVEGLGALDTTHVNTATLTAVVPAGSPAGTHLVSVVTSEDTLTDPEAKLTITGATATPGLTDTPAPTAFIRPLLVVQSYGASPAQ